MRLPAFLLVSLSVLAGRSSAPEFAAQKFCVHFIAVDDLYN